jgi:uncharacterized protein YaeQ
MASNATIFKVALQIADLDRNYYRDHALTIARHPSETDERMMIRLLAFVRHAHEGLAFGRGLSTEDEPDLWQKDLTGAIELWIDVGLRDERDIRRACGRAERVVIYAYGGRSAGLWWEQNREKLERLDNLTVLSLTAENSRSLARLAQRTMSLQCTVQEEQVWIGNLDETVQVEITPFKSASRPYGH